MFFLRVTLLKVIVLSRFFRKMMKYFKIYGKCSKISNTLKLRTPKIIAENNF